jgi:hypothetical protein
MHHLKSFSPGLESVLFRTLFHSCRELDKGLRKKLRLAVFEPGFAALSTLISIRTLRGAEHKWFLDKKSPVAEKTNADYHWRRSNKPYGFLWVPHIFENFVVQFPYRE